jgi:hypothetical protein
MLWHALPCFALLCLVKAMQRFGDLKKKPFPAIPPAHKKRKWAEAHFEKRG